MFYFCGKFENLTAVRWLLILDSYVLDIRVSFKTGRRTLPATKDELIDYAQRSGAPLEVIENLQEMEDEGEIYECMEDIWPDYPSKEDFFFNEEEY